MSCPITLMGLSVGEQRKLTTTSMLVFVRFLLKKKKVYLGSLSVIKIPRHDTKTW